VDGLTQSSNDDLSQEEMFERAAEDVEKFVVSNVLEQRYAAGKYKTKRNLEFPGTVMIRNVTRTSM
jgi:hypothetical protein